jgi:hypothetical protein
VYEVLLMRLFSDYPVGTHHKKQPAKFKAFIHS